MAGLSHSFGLLLSTYCIKIAVLYQYYSIAQCSRTVNQICNLMLKCSKIQPLQYCICFYNTKILNYILNRIIFLPSPIMLIA